MRTPYESTMPCPKNVNMQSEEGDIPKAFSIAGGSGQKGDSSRCQTYAKRKRGAMPENCGHDQPTHEVCGRAAKRCRQPRQGDRGIEAAANQS